MDQKLGLFDKIPDQCLSCLSPFDKKNKKMVMSWTVVVREKEGLVNLYCPDCWNRAKATLEELKNENIDNGKEEPL